MSKWIFFVFALLVLSACSDGGSNGEAMARQKLPHEWDISKVRISCPSGDCPQGVGALIFVDTDSGEGGRCSGSLISSDQVLANAHCDHTDMDEAYFVLPASGNSTIVRKIMRGTVWKEGREELGRDIAIFRLSAPITDVAPKKIARKTPKALAGLVGFFIDDPRDEFVNFQLNKKVCETVPHQPFFNMGLEDKKISLGLFNCSTPIIPGNSGGAFFALHDLNTIEALVNSAWNLSSAREVKGMFYKFPSYMYGEFASAERVHCLPIPGWNEPEETCKMVDILDSYLKPLKAAARHSVETWHKKPRTTKYAEYALVPLTVKYDHFTYLGEGLALIPRPICLKSPGAKDDLDAPLVRIAYDESGATVPLVFQVQHMSVHSSESRGDKYADLNIHSADGSIDPGAEVRFDKPFLFKRFNTVSILDLPNCDENSREEGLAQSLQALENGVGLLQPSSLKPPGPTLPAGIVRPL